MSSKLACITLDTEPDHNDPEKRVRLFEDPELFEKYVAIINRHKLKVTMFTVASLFDRYSEHFKKLESRIPLEYAVHSYSHDPYNGCSLDEVVRSVEAFGKFSGRSPQGYRAPIGQIDKDGLGHLLNHGFEYDSSVYTSIRPGEFGYFKLHMPNVPFRVTRGESSLVEYPFTSLSVVRIPLALSYVKLVGWRVYSILMRNSAFPHSRCCSRTRMIFIFNSWPITAAV
jgi:peptidoglycan/xylan/chitin deacetylase (PgdA/CDA1 family)